MRQVHNAQDAEDVTQAVFLLLARKARGLSSGVVVPGWLLRATHFASRTLLRAKARRKAHETRAATMNKTTQSNPAGPNSPEADWQAVAPLLDEAIASLGTTSRDALVLRFFRNKSYREVAERLSIAEPAARQRVARAVAQLRNYFSRRGVILSASALEVMVVAKGVEPAPAAMLSLVTATGIKGAAIAARHAALAQGAAMAMVPVATKAGIVAAIILIATAASVALFRGHRSNHSADLAAQTTPVPVSAPAQAGPIRGRVIDSSGRPAAGAEVMLARVSSPVSVYAPHGLDVLAVAAGPDGGFEFPAEGDATAIVARSDAGVAQVRVADLQNGQPLRLEPWGRIEGTLKVGDTPQVGQTIELSRTGGSLKEWFAWRIMHDARARTDGRGHFVFDRVIPAPASPNQIALKWQLPNSAGPREAQFSVAAGQTLHVQLGGTGRPVIGRLSAPAGLPPFRGEIVTQPPASQPTDATLYMPTIIPVVVNPDGSFRAEDVPAGAYNLILISGDEARGTPISEAIAQANAQFTIAEMPGGRSDEPLDLGTLHASINQRISPGQDAPDFQIALADGRQLRLSALKGKFVLLYLRQPQFGEEPWVTTPDLKVINDRFGDRPDFVLLDVTVNASVGGPSRVQSLALRPWMVGGVDSYTALPSTRPTTAPSEGLPAVYLLSATRLFLIAPDGKCVERSLSARAAFTRLADLLPRQTTARGNVHVNVVHLPPGGGPAARATPSLDATRNVARSARFQIVEGQPGELSGGLAVLNDGRLADSDDDPSANFFFAYGSLEGRFRMDLPELTAIARIETYSRHRTDRGPQVYALYACDGQSKGFDPKPPIGVDPASCGWNLIANVDTRPASGPSGGQYAVSIEGKSGPIGQFRHLLFVTYVTETSDDWGHTFFSEIEAFRQEGRP